MHVTQSRYCANLFFSLLPSFLSCFVLVAVLMSHWTMNPFIFHHHRVQIAILSRLGRRRYIFSHRRNGVVSNRPRQKEGGGGGGGFLVYFFQQLVAASLFYFLYVCTWASLCLLYLFPLFSLPPSLSHSLYRERTRHLSSSCRPGVHLPL